MLQRWNLLSWSSLLYDLNDSTDSKEASDLRMYDVCEISVLLERWCLAGCPVQVNSYERTMCIGRIWSVTKDSVPSLAFVTFSHSLSLTLALALHQLSVLDRNWSTSWPWSFRRCRSSRSASMRCHSIAMSRLMHLVARSNHIEPADRQSWRDSKGCEAEVSGT